MDGLHKISQEDERLGPSSYQFVDGKKGKGFFFRSSHNPPVA